MAMHPLHHFVEHLTLVRQGNAVLRHSSRND
jgi:hypothetical protein